MYKIGVLGAADIAYRMFIPALLQSKKFECVGIAEEYAVDKLSKFETDYQLDTYLSFDDLINHNDIDVLYIPLPPALHFQYAKKALLKGKHVFLEKPLTISLQQSIELINLAKKNGLVIQENYMFQYHNQINKIKEIIDSKRLGDLRLIRSTFSFPKRLENDFRYSRKMGGGALLDAGGYVIKLATLLLKDKINVDNANLYYNDIHEVDMYGDFTISTKSLTFQGSFGMDNNYNCSLEIHGSNGKLTTNRIYTSPPGNQPSILLEIDQEKETILVDQDNHFIKSINRFYKALSDEHIKQTIYDELLLQSTLLDEVRKKGEYND